MRIAAFIIALLLLGGSIDPTRGWLITMVVLTGLPAMRFRPWAPLRLRPALDARLGAFVLSLVLLAGAVEADKNWLIALSAVTGVAAFMPKIVTLEAPESRHWRTRVFHGGFRRSTWGGDDWS